MLLLALLLHPSGLGLPLQALLQGLGNHLQDLDGFQAIGQGLGPHSFLGRHELVVNSPGPQKAKGAGSEVGGPAVG